MAFSWLAMEDLTAAMKENTAVGVKAIALMENILVAREEATAPRVAIDTVSYKRPSNTSPLLIMVRQA